MNLEHMVSQLFKNKTILTTISRSDFYKLQMICEAVNQNVNADDELTPDIIATRVLETFIREAFEDSTNRIVRQILPEARGRRR